ncbi:hypothetical protein KUTeg_002769 [Tegillarca granosa]|uniref:C1q domain-containing protein n=1 Tax=Tegillarca granosa TaxID=220873 RepID=A0ABQ9FQW5_TEGGR|nr:hypothetical protein KUTeg_002769 [Tegillarca granosa]
MVFGHVITNIGEGYNASDGKFYCPKDGLYLFSVTLEGTKAHFHERGVTGGYPSASVTVAGKLVSGDQVWVRGVGISYRPYSYFTVILGTKIVPRYKKHYVIRKT